MIIDHAGPFDPHFSRVKAGEITPVSIEKARLGCGYQIYGYRCYRVTFSDGTTFSTSNWMYPESPKTLRRVEEAFGITLKESAHATDISKMDQPGSAPG